MIGASVLIKGSMYGVITNIDGMFELSCPIKSSDVLVVSFVGMKTVEQPVGNSTKFNVVMHAAATDLEEIVVVGYGTSSVRDLTRYNTRISTELSVLPILRFGLNATMSYTDQSNAGTSLFSAQGYRPDRPIYDDKGEFDLTDGSPNPVANTYQVDNDDIYRVLGTVYGEVDIIKGLKFRSSLSANVEFNQNLSFTPSFLSNRKEASGSENHFRSSKTVFDNTLSYNYTFNKNHVLDAVAGVSFEKYTSRSTYLSGSDYPDDEIYTNIGSATKINSWSNGYNAYGLFSSF